MGEVTASYYKIICKEAAHHPDNARPDVLSYIGELHK